MAFGWEGEKVRLVPIDIEKHLENYVLWLNDPEITATLSFGEFPMTLKEERKVLERLAQNSKTEVVFAIETLEGRHIGASGVHQISFHHGTAVTGTFIGDKDLWGQGYGRDAIRVRTRYCFEVLNLRMLLSCYLEGNERSKRMQESVGYAESGRVPNRFWKQGKYVDEIHTYCTREMWEATLRQ